MAGFLDRTSRIPITNPAKTLLKAKSRSFSERLTVQSQLNAHHEGHSAVAEKHVEDAFMFLMRGQASRTKLFEFGATLSGIVVGAGLSFLVEELTRDEGTRADYTMWAMGLTLLFSIFMTLCLMVRG